MIGRLTRSFALAAAALLTALPGRVQAQDNSRYRVLVPDFFAQAGAKRGFGGDVADALYLIVSGTFRLAETGIVLSPGTVVGEMGLLSPGGLRTQSLVCEESGDVLSVTYTHFKEIYFQNPQFGFYFLKLITQRLFANNRGLEAELAQYRSAATGQA